MLTTDDMNAALEERAGPLWKIEDCMKVIKAQMPLLGNEVSLAEAEMSLSDGECKAVDKDLELMMMSLRVAFACTSNFHKTATRIIEAQEGLIVPLTGGTGKGDDDDDDDDGDPPLGGG